MDNRDDEVRCRLDRTLSTNSWLARFPLTRVCHLNPSKSDHLPVLVEIQSASVVWARKGRRFLFEEMWLQGEGCNNVIQGAWVMSCKGVPLFQVCEKIYATRMVLLEWQRNVFGSTRLAIAKVREKLGVLFEHPPSMESRVCRVDLMDNLDALLSREETFWRQRSRT